MPYDDGFSRFLSQRFGRRPPAYADAILRADDMAPQLGSPSGGVPPEMPPVGGAAQMPEEATPTVATGPAEVASTEPELLRQLSQALQPEEERALKDSRTSADMQAARRAFNDVSNVFREHVGLAPKPYVDPYVTERESMRDWVMRRAGVARQTETAAQQAARTQAYAESVRQQELRRLADAEREARKAGREAEADANRRKREAVQDEIEREKLSIGKKMLGVRAADIAERRREREARTQLAAVEGVPYGYKLKPGANPSKKQREDAATAVEQRDAVAPIVTRLEQLTSSGLERLASPAARAEVQQAAQQIGAAIRTIENLGVPSGPDMKIQLDLIGDPTSPINEVAGVLPALMKNLRDYFNNKTETRLRTFGIERAAAETPAAPPTAGGMVMMRQKSTGKTKQVSRSTADELLKKHGADFEEVR